MQQYPSTPSDRWPDKPLQNQSTSAIIIDSKMISIYQKVVILSVRLNKRCHIASPLINHLGHRIRK
jgi:hypothetical protein